MGWHDNRRMFKKIVLNLFLYVCLVGFVSGCQSRGDLVEKNKIKAQYHLELAQNYLKSGKNPAAIEELQNALNMDPTNAMAHYQMALSLYHRQRIQQALYHFDQSLIYDKKNTAVRNDYILLLLEQRKYAEAYKQTQISVDDLTYPDPAQSYYLMSLAAMPLAKRQPSYRPALKKALITSLNYNSKHCGALFNLGKYYSTVKQPKKAYVLYHKSLKNCRLPKDKEMALAQLIPLSKKFRLVYQWKRYNQLKAELSKQEQLSKTTN